MESFENKGGLHLKIYFNRKEVANNKVIRRFGLPHIVEILSTFLYKFKKSKLFSIIKFSHASLNTFYELILGLYENLLRILRKEGVINLEKVSLLRGIFNKWIVFPQFPLD